MKKNRQIKLGKRFIGEGNPTYIIAEIGSNHNQDLDTALLMIQKAAETGCDAVKFQSIKFDELYLKEYETKEFENWFKKIELNERWYKILHKQSMKYGLDFISAPTYLKSIDLLEDLKVTSYKLASPQVQSDHRIVNKVAKLNKPVFLSMGYCDIKEIKNIINLFKNLRHKKFIPLHCISHYPSAPEDANLKFINKLSSISGQPVGFSDHSSGSHLALAAVMLGACVIEKHVTLNKKSKGPDHHFAMSFKEFKKMVTKIRDIEKATKNCQDPLLSKEVHNYRDGVSLKVFTKNNIKKNSKINLKDLMFYRSNQKGILYSKIDKIINMKSRIDINRNTLLTMNILKK
tara:strand:- start:902 stop:1939 length:1038 start_codon:yes stop_codon:yes gene_type:complete